jgi:hypothetical protein
MVAFDLRDAVLAPEFMDNFQVVRRSQQIDNYGRANNIPVWTVVAIGVVTAASPDQLRRLPDQQNMSKTIEIVTTFPLQGPSEGVDPDLISWNGNAYIIQILDDWSNYGPGFVHVVCTSTDSVEQPPVSTGVGQPVTLE